MPRAVSPPSIASITLFAVAACSCCAIRVTPPSCWPGYRVGPGALDGRTGGLGGFLERVRSGNQWNRGHTTRGEPDGDGIHLLDAPHHHGAVKVGEAIGPCSKTAARGRPGVARRRP